MFGRVQRCQEPLIGAEPAILFTNAAWDAQNEPQKGGLMYHVLNRANARMTIFDKDEDFHALERTPGGNWGQRLGHPLMGAPTG